MRRSDRAKLDSELQSPTGVISEWPCQQQSSTAWVSEVSAILKLKAADPIAIGHLLMPDTNYNIGKITFYQKSGMVGTATCTGMRVLLRTFLTIFIKSSTESKSFVGVSGHLSNQTLKKI